MIVRKGKVKMGTIDKNIEQAIYKYMDMLDLKLRHCKKNDVVLLFKNIHDDYPLCSMNIKNGLCGLTWDMSKDISRLCSIENFGKNDMEITMGEWVSEFLGVEVKNVDRLGKYSKYNKRKYPVYG